MKKPSLFSFFLLATAVSTMLSSCYTGYYGHGRTAADETRATSGSMSPSKR